MVSACSGGDGARAIHSDAGGQSRAPDAGAGGAPADASPGSTGGTTAVVTPVDGGTDASVTKSDGGTGAPLPDYRSGTRLRATLYETEDGDRMWHGWYDSQLKTACSFRLAEDGQTRCLPPEFTNFYADPACKNPLFSAGSGCTIPTHVQTQATTGCGGNALLAVGAKTIPTELYEMIASTCTDVGAPDAANQYYSASPLPANTAVSGKPLRDARGTDLMLDYIESEDGALEPVSAYDPARGSACNADIAPFDVRCTPSELAYVSAGIQFWQDQACTTTRLAAKFGCPTLKPAAVSLRLTAADPCGNGKTTLSFAELGAETSGVSFAQGQLGCGANTVSSNERLFTVGAPILPATMPTVGMVDSGAGRIKLRYVTAGSGEKILVRALYDSQRSEECQLTTTAEGLRCIPNADIVSSFSDDKCTKAVTYVNLPTASCPAQMPSKFVRSGGWTKSCWNQLTDTHYFAVGSKLTNPDLYTGVNTCDPNASTSGVDVYDTTEIPTTSFAPLKDVTE